MLAARFSKQRLSLRIRLHHQHRPLIQTLPRSITLAALMPGVLFQFAIDGQLILIRKNGPASFLTGPLPSKSVMPLARPLGNFDAPGSKFSLRFPSTPKRRCILFLKNNCNNGDSIHSPVEPEDKMESFKRRSCQLTIKTIHSYLFNIGVSFDFKTKGFTIM